jgi:hypothetical protein
MSDIKIKTQSLPERCEICHKSDCFDPLKNYCSRCAGVKLSAYTPKQPQSRRRNRNRRPDRNSPLLNPSAYISTNIERRPVEQGNQAIKTFLSSCRSFIVGLFLQIFLRFKKSYSQVIQEIEESKSRAERARKRTHPRRHLHETEKAAQRDLVATNEERFKRNMWQYRPSQQSKNNRRYR